MKEFRTIELSDPRFESNGLRFMTVKSRFLKGRGDICIYVPEGIEPGRPLPVVILLHGVYGSAWAWALQAGVHLQTAGMIRAGLLPPMVLVMPSDGLWGDGSGYLPHQKEDFEKWIAIDVVAAVRLKLPAVGPGSPFFIAGLSMGGFGAMRIGINYPGLFSGISIHSAITSLDQMRLFIEEDLGNLRQTDPKQEDLLELCLVNKERLIPLRIDCGTDDPLIDYNRRLHQGLLEAGIGHAYYEYEGGHQWAYWERHIGQSLMFFAGSLPG